MKTKILGITERDISVAAEIIKNGGLVAFPTETVYGLGANALDETAVRKVYEAKGRPSDNPMIVHISSFDDMGKLTDNITEDMRTLMGELWPGPLTMVVHAKDIIPKVTTGGLDTVAVRMPSGEVAAALIRAAGVPIAAPSANISGRPSPTAYKHCIDDLSGRIDAIICGDNCEIGIESTVVDLTGEVPVILRPGIITREALSEVLGKNVQVDSYLLLKPEKSEIGGGGVIDPACQAVSRVELKGEEQERKNISPNCNEIDITGSAGLKEQLKRNSRGTELKPKSPGMKYRHYAPKAQMAVYRGEREAVLRAISAEELRLLSEGKRVEVIKFPETEPELAAREFFARLRESDNRGIDIILAAALPEEGVGFAVMNRMFKSAGYNIIDV